MNNPWFFAIIPADVRYSDIEANAKLLYWEISALANREWYCFASNGYFADLYKVNIRSIVNWIFSLQKNEFIRVENINWTRKIFLVNIGKNFPTPTKIFSYPKENIFLHNNTSNNTSNTSSLVSSEEEQKKEKKENEFVESFEELKLFVNRWKIESDYPWKNFDDTLSDLFLYYEEKGKKIKKVNTMLVVSKWFKWRDEQKAREEKETWQNSQQKKNYFINDPQKEEIEQNKRMRLEAEVFLRERIDLKPQIEEIAYNKAISIARWNEKIAMSLKNGLIYKVAYEMSLTNK